MVADKVQVTSLQAPPEGWEAALEARARRDLGKTYFAGSTSISSQDGPRADAEPTVDLPTLTPGIDTLPTACTSCGSCFLNREPPMGQHQRGLISCETCGRQLCWLKPEITVPQPSRPFAPAAPTLRRMGLPSAPARAPTLSTFQADDEWDQPGCGPACSGRYGHNAATHEAYGAAQASAAQQASAELIRTGPLTIELDTREARVSGALVPLSLTEFKVLAQYALRLGRTVSHHEAITAIWGAATAAALRSGEAHGPDHMLRVHMTRLRPKLGAAAALLETRRWFGYMLRAEPPIEEKRGRSTDARPRLQRRGLRYRLDARPGRPGRRLVVGARSRRVDGQAVVDALVRLRGLRNDIAATCGERPLQSVRQLLPPDGEGAPQHPGEEEMTSNGRLKLAIPPGYADARCLVCQVDVIIPENTLRCPNGGHDVEITSLAHMPTADAPRRLTVEVQDRDVPLLAPQTAVTAPQAAAKVETIALPSIDAAISWHADTVRLHQQMLDDEMRLARELKLARQMRRFLDVVLGKIEAPETIADDLDEEEEAAPAPIAVVELPSPPVITEERELALSAPPPPTTGRPWSRAHAACITCGMTERKHAAAGRCTACNTYWRDKGVERPLDLDNKETPA